MLTVVCVYRSGGIYNETWVAALAKQVRRFLKEDYRFVCLTDKPYEVQALGIETETLQTNWSGWWSKVELFREGLFQDRVLYLDLDVIITGPLERLVQSASGFTGCDDFYVPGTLNSSVMSWRGDYSILYELMLSNASDIKVKFENRSSSGNFGDQGYIEAVIRNLGKRIEFFPSEYVVSWKKAARYSIPTAASVVAFHGKPKMPDANGWAATYWKELLSDI